MHIKINRLLLVIRHLIREQNLIICPCLQTHAQKKKHNAKVKSMNRFSLTRKKFRTKAFPYSLNIILHHRKSYINEQNYMQYR